MGNFHIQKRDTLVSVLMMFIMSLAIMGSASGTLHKQGLMLNNVSEMIGILEPLSGKAGMILFVIGIVAAGLSSQFPNILYFPWMLSDYYQTDRNTRTLKMRLVLLFFVSLNLVVPFSGTKPVLVIIVSMALNTLVLPIAIGCLLYLGSSKIIMGKFTFNLWKIIVLALGFLFALTISWISLRGLSGLISDFLRT